MSAGLSTEFEDFSIFEVSFSLTPEGYGNWTAVLREMYEYLSYVQQTDDRRLRLIWRDLKKCGEISLQNLSSQCFIIIKHSLI
jgi:secreted Zn-dependent insulinase-like peptidase